jgi:trk system potassium uptake protein TrkA
MNIRKDRNFAIIGLGVVGSTIATALAAMGEEVLGIDIDESVVSQHADDLTHTVITDARDEDALKEAGLGNYDVTVVAIGEDLEANILATMNAKLIGVPCVWVKAFSRTHHRILSRIGADRVIHPERDMGLHVAEMLHTPFISDYVSLGNGFHVIDFVMQEGMEESTLQDLLKNDMEDVHFLGLMRGTEYLDASRDPVQFQDGDHILVLGRRENLRRLSDKL